MAGSYRLAGALRLMIEARHAARRCSHSAAGRRPHCIRRQRGRAGRSRVAGARSIRTRFEERFSSVRMTTDSFRHPLYVRRPEARPRSSA
jgi:hypothetical protein